MIPVRRLAVAVAIVCAAATSAHAQVKQDTVRKDTASKALPKPPVHDMKDMKDMPGMGDMPGMSGDGMGMSMPIPMPKGMPMIPGLIGLRPAVSPFLPKANGDPMRLPLARPTEVERLGDGDTLDLTAGFVRRMVKGRAFAAYSFNGQVPGPMIRVQRNATIVVRFHNRIDLPSTVHWHGLRQDNRYDGVPGLTQAEVPPGGSFTYRVHFPDAGIYWYHPHVREDIEQAMGLYGNMLVDSPSPDYYSPANQEQVLVLSDLLQHGDSLIPFGKEAADFALSGRVGNLLLVNNEPRYTARVGRGEVVRFYLTNVSSSRTWNLSFGGAPIKVVASDVSRFEREERVPSVVMAPAERYVVEVRFERPGTYALVNQVQAINHVKGEFEPAIDTVGLVTVGAEAAMPDLRREFETLRANVEVSREIDKYRPFFDRAPDLRLRLTLQTSGLPLATVQFMNVDTAYYAPIEWVDGMPDMNWLSTSDQVRWILRDEDSGKENMDIDWHVKAGSVVKLRIFNDARSFHPMQHPIHLHGQRMLVVARDGVPTRNLSWKDTALIPVGSTVDLLIDASNPGAWMLHCHIAEHLSSGMMAVMHVDPAAPR
jgi:FtsP/CotA-like multicopper oxidase with cupredoxin domain